ncbi:hypothetical protein [Methylobacterium sp. GXF4]|jgi:propanediol dehydratase small subunit|uniref:hypothetical protein n=1 Tax=Methylobacterium sp. GXF4 TaxID=1096546 RepID=UPI000FFEE1C5|nr:hypothetical protein [Methylobacterium sp. GXF4]
MSDSTKTALERIAQALGVPEEAFLGNHDAWQSAAVEDPRSEELELLRLFQTIEDPKTRRACLAFVRNAADLINRSCD